MTSANSRDSVWVPTGTFDGPIAMSLVRLALPTTVVLVVQVAVGLVEAYFVSRLGTDALAGVAMVFPVLMLMQMMSNGGFGGGVASAVARALGSQRVDDAQALVWHALVVAVVLGTLFTVAAFHFGPTLYGALGGNEGSREAALTYSNWVFAGAVPIWVVALLSSALRGAGQVKVPALITFASAAVLVPLSPALIFGWGPLPKMGIAGGGAAFTLYYVLAAVALLAYLRSGRGVLRLQPARSHGRLYRDILGVGTLSAIGTVQLNLMVACLTAAVGVFGADAVAGYGTAARLDYLLIPVLFGLGTGVVTMVGLNVGAGRVARARRIAWVGAALGFAIAEAVGLTVAFFPHVWLGLFSSDAHVLAHGATYLRYAGPVYGAVAVGMMLYFAGQGANQVLGAILSGTVRLLLAGLLGWYLVARTGASLDALYRLVAGSALLYGGLTAATLFYGVWSRRIEGGSALRVHV